MPKYWNKKPLPHSIYGGTGEDSGKLLIGKLTTPVDSKAELSGFADKYDPETDPNLRALVEKVTRDIPVPLRRRKE
jgi:hypothetical protein